MATIKPVLISTQDPLYLNFVRSIRQHRNRNLSNWHQKKDSSYDLQLLKWESLVLRCLNTLIPGKSERIIKYQQGGRSLFRELDHVVELPDGYLFCELKLKHKYSENLAKSYTGWKQLNASKSLFSGSQMSVSGVAICVDLSFLRGDGSEAKPNFTELTALPRVLLSEHEDNDKDVIWLDSKALIEYGLNKGIIKPEDIDSFNVALNRRNEASNDTEFETWRTGPKLTNSPLSGLRSMLTSH